MVPSSLLVQASLQRAAERFSSARGAYAPHERRGGPPASRRRRAPRPPLRLRIRGFFRGTSVPASSGARPSPPPVAREGRPAEPRVSVAPEDCEHTEAEYLGASGLTEFLRCLLCGDVLILQPGQAWTLRHGVR